MPDLTLFTIGFTRKSAETFFGLLTAAGVKKILDVRLNNVSQLAGFAKRDDLKYLARELCGIDYYHLPELAPTQEMLQDYRKKNDDWETYRNRFLQLMKERSVETSIAPELIHQGCLLCSEEQPDQCHRRLVVDYLQEHWHVNMVVKHLV